jgi:hypothetical protein
MSAAPEDVAVLTQKSCYRHLDSSTTASLILGKLFPEKLPVCRRKNTQVIMMTWLGLEIENPRVDGSIPSQATKHLAKAHPTRWAFAFPG